MKLSIYFQVALLILIMLFSSCTKSTIDGNSAENQASGLHGYGLNAMKPSDWANVPSFSSSIFSGQARPDGLSYSGTLPTSYLLVTPQIRDQGQIGSCTGFCGAETDEILYYYKNNNISGQAVSGSLTLTNGALTATNNQIPNTSEEPYYSTINTRSDSAALSPLFLYFIERVVINKGTIGSDPGANMVNICQSLQGLSNYSSGKLTYNGYTFAGIPTEPYYRYPFTIASSGYNIATKSTTPYQIYPYTYYNYGSTNIPVAPYNYTIGTQSGGTTSTNGTTNHGYYVITSTTTQLVTDVKTAIANNKPVMMGINIYDLSPSYPYFESLNTNNYTYNPLTSNGQLISGVKLLGGHAVPIVGYINDASQPGGGVFICQNSWGTPWGFHGYFYLPYSVIQSTKIVPSGNLYVAII